MLNVVAGGEDDRRSGYVARHQFYSRVSRGGRNGMTLIQDAQGARWTSRPARVATALSRDREGRAQAGGSEVQKLLLYVA